MNEQMWARCVELAPDFKADMTEAGLQVTFTTGGKYFMLKEGKQSDSQTVRGALLLQRALDILEGTKTRKSFTRVKANVP